MSTATITPVNLVAGQLTPIVPPQFSDIGNGAIAIEIYNNSSSVILVMSEAGNSFLQPLTADLFPFTSLVSAPILNPQTTVPNGTFIGTCTATVYYNGDKLPPIPTFSLPPFPGGAQLIWAPTANTPGSNTGFMFGVVSSPGAGVYVTSTPNNEFQVPEGTTSVSITGWFASVTAGTTTMRLIGVNSGMASSAVTLGGAQVTDGKTVTIPIVGCNDTVFSVQFQDSSGTIDCEFSAIANVAGINQPSVPPASVYANAGPQPPTFPTLGTGIVESSPVIAAPTSGAWYLFTADLSAGAEGDEVNISANGGVIAFLISGAGSANFGDHVNLSGFRATTAITASGLSATVAMVIRYAPGP